VTPREGVTFLELDVASDESVAAAVGQVIDRFGRIDVLVNNAGIGSAGAAEESSVRQAQGVFDMERGSGRGGRRARPQRACAEAQAHSGDLAAVA
jgi:NADP-dependent 3-hydroxy acid dehydrogenase YdfG